MIKIKEVIRKARNAWAAQRLKFALGRWVAEFGIERFEQYLSERCESVSVTRTSRIYVMRGVANHPNPYRIEVQHIDAKTFDVRVIV
jgi:hypothetical protein